MGVYGQKILYFDEVTSTFDKLAEYPPENGLTVVANVQTSGIGRSGRQWASERGGIYFSFYIIPKVNADEIPFTAIVCALAAYRTIVQYVPCGIKWPNDIVCDGKKICGILTKASFIDSSAYVMAGIGINANNSDFGMLSYRANSLRNILEIEVDNKKILSDFFDNFSRIFEMKKEDVIKEYTSHCVTVGGEVALHFNSDEEPKKGKCLSVKDDGSILVDVGDEIISVNYGEVSVRGIYGYC